MAIDFEQITTDITLELDEEEISLADFIKASESFFGLVREMAKEVSPIRDSTSWLVKVYPGSAGIGLLPRPGTFRSDEVNRIRGHLVDGVKQIEKGQRPPYFSDKAIEHTKNLGSLFRSKKAPANVSIWLGKERALSINSTIAAQASALLEAAYEDEGSVDGFLEKLSAHGQFEFIIYDILDNRAIKCEVDESKLQSAYAAFRKRVEVLGKVKYRKDGLPVSVRAKEILPFPSPEEIPSVAEMRKLLKGA